MSDDKEELDNSPMNARMGLLFGIPVLAVAGCIYFIGFFSTAGMPYFTLLEPQDFIVAAAKTIPPVFAYLAVLLFLSKVTISSKWSHHYKQYFKDLVKDKTPEEALRLLDEDKKNSEAKENEYPLFDTLLKNKDGSWDKTKVLNFKFFIYFAIAIWFLLIGLCVAGYQVPVSILLVFGILFTFSFTAIVQYHWYRFDVDIDADIDIYQVWFVQLMALIFLWGVIDARYEQASKKAKFNITLHDNTFVTSSFRRVGSGILFYDQDSDIWRIVQRSDLSILENSIVQPTENRRSR